MRVILLIACLLSFTTFAQNFRQAKIILKEIYKVQPVSFYCGCDIEWVSKNKLIPSKNCDYSPRNARTKSGNVNVRAKRLEWEHLVPAHEFGHQLQCWQEGRRKNCTETSKKFSNMEGDLHNLVPAIGEVNADRSNFRFNLIEGENRVYGACDAEVDFKRRVFEPRPSVRGDIARAYFYFEHQYGLKISNKQKKLYQAWHKQDPVDADECIIHEKKAQHQGNANPFIAKYCD